MRISMVVPIESDGAERDRNWHWLRSYYGRTLRNWEIIEGGCGGEWSKGRAVNGAARAANGSVFVILDADLLVSPGVLVGAVSEVEAGAAWAMPHGEVYRLNKVRTADLLAGDGGVPSPVNRGEVMRKVRPGPVGGGCVVLARAAFESVGGMDERFIGWGGEDISFGRALNTLAGPHVRLWAPAWHLWHEPPPMRPGRRAVPESEALAGRYLDAVGDPELMASVIAR